MLRDFMLIIIGLACGTASPHLALLVNHWRSGNRGGLMTEWQLAWPTFVIEGILIAIVGFILWLIDKRAQRKEDKKEATQNEKMDELIKAVKAIGGGINDRRNNN